MSTLESLQWRNKFQSLGESFFQRVRPAPLKNIRLVSANAELGALLGVSREDLASSRFLRLMNGEERLSAFDEIATVYSGHQFGVYVPQLGDGRAIMLGETVSRTGGAEQGFEWQVKGAGLTRYSRMGDGRAVLRSALREYLASEAMHALGVSTTRALAVMTSDTDVMRETVEKGALTVRIATSFIRFGHFEFFSHTGQKTELKKLADFTIESYFGAKFSGQYAAWFEEIVRRTARLMAQWQSVGFCHGVMNSDNFSILGDTLDYGPFGLLERFDANFVCNHSDEQGRYAYMSQPEVGFFNLRALAQALTPLISVDELRTALSSYNIAFESEYALRMLEKLALESSGTLESDVFFVSRLLEAMHEARVDYTGFFRILASCESSDGLRDWVDRNKAGSSEAFGEWAKLYFERVRAAGVNPQTRRERLKAKNPKVVPRNHWLQFLIEEAEAGRYKPVNDALARLARPFDDVENEIDERFLAPIPFDETPIEVSCSS